MKQVKIVIEKHADGYIAYPVGIKGVIVGEGVTYDEALHDIQSALKFHLDTFGPICRQADITREDFLSAYERA